MKYLINQLTQMSAWLGVCVILAAIFATRGEIIILGIVMVLLHDSFIKDRINAWAPGLSKWIQSAVDDL